MLVPASRMYPSAGQGFLAGLRGALSASGLDYELLAEPVGTCAVKDQVADRIQRLLLHEPHVVTGVMGSGVLRHVHSHFLDAGVPFIATDLGGDPLMTGGTRNPFIFWNTLGLWHSTYALGAWAARNVGANACVAAGLHDAGYGLVQAFWLGFAGEGGTVLATEVTHRDSADEDPSGALERLASHAPDFVMAFYAGREGIAFAKAWAALGLAGRLPLLATPLMTHAYWRPSMPDGTLDGLRTACAWDLSARTPALDAFRTACGVEPGAEPAVFALLGYEAGLLIAAGASRAGSVPPSGRAWRDALSGAAFDSPRGALRVDEDWGEVAAVDHLLQWRRGAAGALEIARLSSLDAPGRRADDYAAIRAGDVRSGWFNPYLVT